VYGDGRCGRGETAEPLPAQEVAPDWCTRSNPQREWQYKGNAYRRRSGRFGRQLDGRATRSSAAVWRCVCGRGLSGCRVPPPGRLVAADSQHVAGVCGVAAGIAGRRQPA
jgi:hypothetical protein